MLVKHDAIGTAIERIVWVHGDRVQIDALIERKRQDIGHAVNNRDVGQTGAAIEESSESAGSGDAVVNCEIGQGATVPKCLLPDVRHSVRYPITASFSNGALDKHA